MKFEDRLISEEWFSFKIDGKTFIISSMDWSDKNLVRYTASQNSPVEHSVIRARIPICYLNPHSINNKVYVAFLFRRFLIDWTRGG